MNVVHWSDCSSQPSVRIACSKLWGNPWHRGEDLPKEVYEFSNNGERILYAFNERLVSCEECCKLDEFKLELNRLREYDRKRKESGLTAEEYGKKIQQEFIDYLKENKE